ncbi:hypothetical protein [Euzebya rosea]|uniref:hypothetical protein n=1 Tax=Euzebya rosea TaxID=2052804 RepID=UPI000D3E90CB|nr:hypothetical protein [Euzebya rosea]
MPERRPRVRLADKVIGPIMRRVIVRAGELGIIDVRGRVLLAVLALTVSWNRVEDTVDLRQVMYYAGLCRDQGGRDNKHGRRMAREALYELREAGMITLVEPDQRLGSWWIAVPDWALGTPDEAVDNPAGQPVDNPGEGGQSPPFTRPERGRSAPSRGSIAPLQGGQSPPDYVPKSSEGIPSRAPARTRGPTRPVQLQLALVWIRELTGDGLDTDDPICTLLLELDEADHQALADLARELADPAVAHLLDDDDLADWIPELLHELHPDRIPPPAGVQQLATMHGPLAHRLLAAAAPTARQRLSEISGGLVRPMSDRPDDPVIRPYLADAITNLTG